MDVYVYNPSLLEAAIKTEGKGRMDWEEACLSKEARVPPFCDIGEKIAQARLPK